jgi:hypothetical protein
MTVDYMTYVLLTKGTFGLFDLPLVTPEELKHML